MKIMVVGGGGREHAIIQKIKENPAVEVIYALPGNAGMRDDAVCINIEQRISTESSHLPRKIRSTMPLLLPTIRSYSVRSTV